VSWVTPDEPGNGTVAYGRSPEKMVLSAQATLTRYSYYNYTSGFIHHCNLTGLKHGVKYYYAMGFGHTVRTFSFTAPPKPGPDVPFKFGLIGTYTHFLRSLQDPTFVHFNVQHSFTSMFMLE
jgi:hypothetical protein